MLLTYNRSRFILIVAAAFLSVSPLMSTTFQFAMAESAAISTLQVGPSPSEIAFNPINGSMYIVTSNSVSVIDAHTNKFLTNIQFPPGHFLGKIAFNPNNSNMYVTFANDSGNYVAVISAKENKVIDNVYMDTVIDNTHLLLRSPNAIAYNPMNGLIYVPAVVTNYDFNASSFTNSRNSCLRNITVTCVVSVIDSHNKIIKNIPVGRQGEGDGTIAFDEKNGYTYVGNYQDRSVSVIDSKSNNVLKLPILLSGPPSAIAYNPKNGNMYVAGGSSNVVSVIDPCNHVKPITGVGINPNNIAYNPKNGNMYVAGGFSKSIFVIDPEDNKVVNNTIVGTGPNDIPNSIAYNPMNGNMYVTIGFSDTVKVIEPIHNGIVDTIPVREGALKIALDPINNNMYVTSPLNNTVSVIGP